MKSCFGKTLLILPTFYILAAFAEPNNTSPIEVQNALLQVQKQMKKLGKSIYRDKKEEKRLQTVLTSLDKEIENTSENLLLLQRKMTEHTQTLTLLENEQIKLKDTTLNHQAALTQLLQATFLHYRKEKLKLLFEQEEASLLSRQNQYYEFFCHARAEQINALQKYLKHIQSLQDKIKTEKGEIQKLAEKQQLEKSLLLQAKEKRQVILNALAQKLFSNEEQLVQLQQQEQHLEEIFKAIQKKIATTPTYIEPAQDFAKAKHQLSLPVMVGEAKLIPLPHLNKASKKSYISAPYGTPVNAIFPGRIVFAESLRGLGLLIIVDHGNGYMSLYGNNQKLYKGLGDWVNQGEMIASVGQSGTYAQGGLYFEIRKDGEALDPTPWFKA